MDFDIAAIVAIAFKGLLSLVLAIGGIYAIRGGIRLFLDGVGIKRDGSTVEIKRKELNIKVTASSVGALLMFTACGWGYIAYLAVPSLRYDSYGPVVTETPPMDPNLNPGVAVAERLPPTATLPDVIPGSQADLIINVGDRVYFDLDRSDLGAVSRDTLRNISDWMAEHTDVSLTIEGHANEPGTHEYNVTLGERRANSTRDFLVEIGVDTDRLTTISYGEKRPAVFGSNEQALSENRRVVFVVN